MEKTEGLTNVNDVLTYSVNVSATGFYVEMQCYSTWLTNITITPHLTITRSKSTEPA